MTAIKDTDNPTEFDSEDDVDEESGDQSKPDQFVDAELGSAIPLAQTAQVAVGITNFRVTSDGIKFVLRQWADPFKTVKPPLGFSDSFDRNRDDLNRRIRFAVVHPNGVTTVLTDKSQHRCRNHQDAEYGIATLGTGGVTGISLGENVEVWPLLIAPEGEYRLVFEWSAYGIGQTHLVIPASVIAELASRVQPIWPRNHLAATAPVEPAKPDEFLDRIRIETGAQIENSKITFEPFVVERDMRYRSSPIFRPISAPERVVARNESVAVVVRNPVISADTLSFTVMQMVHSFKNIRAGFPVNVDGYPAQSMGISRDRFDSDPSGKLKLMAIMPDGKMIDLDRKRKKDDPLEFGSGGSGSRNGYDYESNVYLTPVGNEVVSFVVMWRDFSLGAHAFEIDCGELRRDHEKDGPLWPELTSGIDGMASDIPLAKRLKRIRKIAKAKSTEDTAIAFLYNSMRVLSDAHKHQVSERHVDEARFALYLTTHELADQLDDYELKPWLRDVAGANITDDDPVSLRAIVRAVIDWQDSPVSRLTWQSFDSNRRGRLVTRVAHRRNEITDASLELYPLRVRPEFVAGNQAIQ